MARLLLDPGDAVWMEEPGYPGAQQRADRAPARASCRCRWTRTVSTSKRASGARRDARLAYVTPSHQFPLGVVMSLPRRLALLKWASAAEAWVVEDDYDSEFRHGTRPVPCLHGMDVDNRVIYVGTFSKSLFPSLRLGFVVVPPDLRRAAGGGAPRAGFPAAGAESGGAGGLHGGRPLRAASAADARRVSRTSGGAWCPRRRASAAARCACGRC